MFVSSVLILALTCHVNFNELLHLLFIKKIGKVFKQNSSNSCCIYTYCIWVDYKNIWYLLDFFSGHLSTYTTLHLTNILQASAHYLPLPNPIQFEKLYGLQLYHYFPSQSFNRFATLSQCLYSFKCTFLLECILLLGVFMYHHPA